VESAAEVLHYDSWGIKDVLARTGVALDESVLSELAAWEPRSFRSLVAVAAAVNSLPKEQGGLGQRPSGPGTPVFLGRRVYQPE